MRSMSCTAATQVESQPSVSAAAEATGGLRAGGGLPGNVTEASAMEQLALAIWDPGARAECARAPPAARRSRDLGARAPTPAPALTQCLPGSRGEAGPHGRAGRAGHAQGGHQERARDPDPYPGPGARAPRWLLEGASTSTRENAVLSLAVAERRGALDRRAPLAAAAPSCHPACCHPGAPPRAVPAARPRPARGARALACSSRRRCACAARRVARRACEGEGGAARAGAAAWRSPRAASTCGGPIWRSAAPRASAGPPRRGPGSGPAPPRARPAAGPPLASSAAGLPPLEPRLCSGLSACTHVCRRCAGSRARPRVTALARAGGVTSRCPALQVYVARAPPTAWRGAWLPAGLAALLWRFVLLRELLALAYYWARGWLC